MLNPSQLLPPLPEKTDVVSLEIQINGNAIPDNLEVTHVSVNRSFNRIPYAVIRILGTEVSNAQREISDMDILSPGNTISIKAGYYTQNETIFEGIIIRHALKINGKQAPVIEIESKDVAVKMTIDRKNKYFADLKDSDIIEEISSSYGITGQIEDTADTHPEMVQYHATDWDFILTRAEANAKLVWVKDGELIVAKPDFEGEAGFVLSYGSSIYEFEAEMDARDQFPAVQATSWDHGNQELIAVEATADGVSPSGGLLGGLSGAASALSGAAQSLAGAVGISLPGVPPNTDYREVLGVKNHLLQHSGKLSQGELEKWAEAKYQKSKLARLRGRVKFEGVAAIYPGDRLELQKVGLRHEGKVFVTAVRHEINNGSWFSHAQFGLPQEWFVEAFPDVNDAPASALLPAVRGLQIGIVTLLASDPEQEDRIKVRLPVLSADGEGIWMRLAAQDAGPDRGAFFRPEIGDEVIVGFVNDDPREAVVLGTLHSKDRPAPLVASDDNHEKGWVTRSGIKMIFNDDLISFNLTTPAGNKVAVDDDDQSILLEDQHGNRVLMNSDGITITSAADLKLSASGDVVIEGTNIENSANSKFSATGNSKASLESSADVVVKGSFVKIN